MGQENWTKRRPEGEKRGAHAAQVPGRVGPTKWGLGHLLAWGFLSTPSSSPKSYALIFPSPSEAAAAAKLLIPSEGDQILLLRSSGEGGNHRHRRHLSSLAWEEASTSSPSPRPAPSPSSSPWSTPSPSQFESCYTLDTCLVLLFMFVIEYLSLFGGEVIISDCVVPLMPLNIIMFARCE